MHLNLNKSGFLSEEGHSGFKSQNIAIRTLKANFPFQIWFKWTYEANLVSWRGSSKDKFAFSDHNFTHRTTLIFCSFLNNVEITVCKICF